MCSSDLAIEPVDDVSGIVKKLINVPLCQPGDLVRSILAPPTVCSAQLANQLLEAYSLRIAIRHDLPYSLKPSTMTVPLRESWWISMKPSLAASRSRFENER